MEPRIAELELRYTEQQALLQELSEVLWQQQRTLDALRAEVAGLRSRVAGEEPGAPGDPAAERPPHY